MSRMPEPCGMLTTAILRQRARLLEALFADGQHHPDHDRQQHEDTENGVADDDDRVPAPAERRSGNSTISGSIAVRGTPWGNTFRIGDSHPGRAACVRWLP